MYICMYYAFPSMFHSHVNVDSVNAPHSIRLGRNKKNCENSMKSVEGRRYNHLTCNILFKTQNARYLHKESVGPLLPLPQLVEKIIK
jgi:hypothetical protein